MKFSVFVYKVSISFGGNLLNIESSEFIFNSFAGRNYLFNLHRIVELLKINSKLSIFNEFPPNETPVSRMPARPPTPATYI